MGGAAALAAAGAWLLQQQAQLPSAALVFLGLPLILAARHWHASPTPALRALARLAGACAWCGAGFLWAALQAQWRLADELPARWEGRDLRLGGVVTGLPGRTSGGWRFGFEVETVDWPADAHAPRRVLLTLPAEEGEALPGALAPVEPGDRLTLVARLKRPHGTANPHGFDAEAWLLEHGWRATGSVRLDQPFVRHGLAGGDLQAALDRWRARTRAHLADALDDPGLAAVLTALAIGDQGGIDADRWQLYARTGVTHLVSISGLHITMLAALAAWVCRRLWQRSAGLVRRLPAVDAAAWAGLAVALAYGLVSGLAVPAQRTLWMLAVVVLAGRLRTRTSVWDVLGVALLAVLALDPAAVGAAGFWLSFGAVGLLVATDHGHGGGWRRLVRWSRAQWALFLGMAPLLLALFQQVSLAGPLANAFAIPAVGLLVVPLSLLAAVLPWPWPAQVAASVLALVERALDVLAGLPFAQYVQHAPPLWAVALGLAGALWLLLPRGFPGRLAGVPALLPLFLAAPAPPPPGHAAVTLLDVGQGLAVVVRTRAHALLFDAGPAWSAEADSASRVILPYLRGEGVTRLGAVVASHDDRDHTGGLRTLLRTVEAGVVYAGIDPASPRVAGLAGVRPCEAGEGWDWDGVRFDFLHPPPGAPPPRTPDNARGCVLRVEAGGTVLLLTADIEAGVESDLVARGAPLRAHLLVAPHHGSRTSSSPGFLDAVAPRVAWFATGYRNRFGHPHPEVSARYAARGVRQMRSDQSGALMARLGPAGLEVSAWREQRPRWWQGR